MAKRRKTKVSNTAPDEYFSSGPLEFARFGKHVIGRSRADAGQFDAIQAKMAESLPKVVAEIDELVSKIATQVAGLPPDRLLHRAWWNLAAVMIGLEGKEEDSDQSIAMRMIDYVQSVIASVEPVNYYAEDVGDQEWATLLEGVRTLFAQLLDYQMCLTAHLRVQDPNLDMELEEFRFQAESLWLNVRGKRYTPHERQALLDVLMPHSDILTRLFGIDAPTLVAELDKILAKLTHGLHDAFMDLKHFKDDTIGRASKLSEETAITDLDVLRDNIFEDPRLAVRRDKVAGEIFGLDLFDVEKIAKLPKALLDELAWSPGEEREFFAPGQFCGWPLRVWPTMKRPFLRLNGRILCFDKYALFDNFYRVLQRAIFRLAPDYKQTWNDRQKTVSEEIPFAYLERLLPGACVYRPVYYRWKVDSGSTQWHEADGLLIYDDHLFVIEMKSGAFTYTSPATDLPAHIDSLKNLVQNPASQGSRFVDYLESAAEVSIADSDHNEIGRLRRSNFRHITVCAVTLDAFTELAARAQRLQRVGIDVGQRSVWVLSIDDLRVYADLFNNPLVFLHFVEQRMCAVHTEFVDLDDEMDHLGLYITHNNYGQYATKLMRNAKTDKLVFHGYRTPIDKYYSAIVQDEKPILPKQKMPARLAEIIEFLAASSKPGRSQLASFLLDAAGDYRKKIAQTIDRQLRDNIALGRARPVSTHGKHAFTIWFWSSSAPRNAAVALEHAREVVAAHDEQSRLMVELEYSAEEILSEMHWRYVDLKGLSDAEIARIRHAGLLLRRQRVAAARAQRKIGANEPCPCGSGLKYKRCCRP